jgi:hypothetical protein
MMSSVGGRVNIDADEVGFRPEGRLWLLLRCRRGRLLCRRHRSKERGRKEREFREDARRLTCEVSHGGFLSAGVRAGEDKSTSSDCPAVNPAAWFSNIRVRKKAATHSRDLCQTVHPRISTLEVPARAWQVPCVSRHFRRRIVTTRNYDDWTIESWKTEPRLSGLIGPELQDDDQAPPLWKDLTLASVVAVLLWVAAALVFG